MDREDSVVASRDQGARPQTGANAWAQPSRVQLRRTAGWRMPPNTVRVCRPSVFGNPYTVDDCGRHDAVEHYRHWVAGPLWEDPHMRAEQERLRTRLPELRGKNLACWCRLDQTCHADVLLALVNAPEDGSRPAGEPRGDAQRRATPDLPLGDA